jgi:hypothetical protein
MALASLPSCALRDGSDEAGPADEAERARSMPLDEGAAGDVVHRKVDRPPHYRAQVLVPTISVHERPDGTSRVTHEFPQHAEGGVIQTFLVEEKRRYGVGASWYRVLLPVKPAGTTGWVRGADVLVEGLRYKLVVRMADLELDLYKNLKKVRTYPIGVGTAETPTPGGHYYVRDVIQVTNPHSAYGPYAFGLSGFSDVLSYWRGGGVIGIHGTNQPDSIGTRASHGCIRMRNEDVTELVKWIRLGTPVSVLN